MTVELNQLIDASVSRGDSRETISRKIFLLFPTHVFKGDYDLQLEFLTEISHFLSIPIASINIIGSAKTGVSLVKGTQFSPQTSDIDVAIVDAGLFTKKFEYSYKISNGWQTNAFMIRNNVEQTTKRKQEFKDYLLKGIFRPEIMPNSPEKGEWTTFFGKLSQKYSQYCNGITAWVYAGESFLIAKQISAINIYLESQRGKSA